MMYAPPYAFLLHFGDKVILSERGFPGSWKGMEGLTPFTNTSLWEKTHCLNDGNGVEVRDLSKGKAF